MFPSCPIDDTFHWHSVNGLAQTSRFSVQMFAMPQRLPLYIHCLANICGPKEDCVKVNSESIVVELDPSILTGKKC